MNLCLKLFVLSRQNIPHMLSRPILTRSFTVTRSLGGLMEFFDTPENARLTTVPAGRPWRVEELRIKSNIDLHKLWYVLLKERNMLMTMQDEYFRLLDNMPSPERFEKVEESMENIMTVVRERDVALEQLERGGSVGQVSELPAAGPYDTQPAIDPHNPQQLTAASGGDPPTLPAVTAVPDMRGPERMWEVDTLGRPQERLAREHPHPPDRDPDHVDRRDRRLFAADKLVPLLRLLRERRLSRRNYATVQRRIAAARLRLQEMYLRDDTAEEEEEVSPLLVDEPSTSVTPDKKS